jgi:uncharacterized protein with gpF-like domain
MKKKKTIPTISANKGVEVKYRNKLKSLIKEMSRSCEYWVSVADEPILAHDASPVNNIKRILKDLRKRWETRFNEAAPKIAELYAKAIKTSSDVALKSALKNMGLSVEFKLTASMKQSLEAIITENISLIKSIPQQYLQQVEGEVMRAFSVGRDLKTMVEGIKKIGGVTQRRAELIAYDQSNKANAVVIRTRQLDLGITKGIWQHSHAGKEPRASHVAANGKEFELTKGCLIDGEYILPGEKIRCRCTWRGVLPI